ncbi:unnamed protein product, partial [marine sediment metagenome]
GTILSGYMDFYNQSLYPGVLPEPVTLIEPDVTKHSEPVLLTCQQSLNAVGYQLLVGSDPYRVMDYTLISDTPAPPTVGITQSELPEGARYWTIKVRDQWGSTIYADPIPLLFLTCTGYELIWQKELSGTEFEYSFRMKVKNQSLYDVENITMEVASTPANITALNSKVFYYSVPAGEEVLSQDTFVVRIDQSSAVDINDIIWQITDEQEVFPPSDLNKTDSIDFYDLNVFERCWLGVAAPEQGLVAYLMLNDVAG